MPRRVTVFFVDDEVDLLATVVPMLEDAGHLVLAARNGHEALERMRGTLPPRVAVVDLVMPEMDGRHLIDAMKEDPDLADIPVIVASARTREATPGATIALQKPYSLDELLAAIETAMSDTVDVATAVHARRR